MYKHLQYGVNVTVFVRIGPQLLMAGPVIAAIILPIFNDKAISKKVSLEMPRKVLRQFLALSVI